MVQWRFVFESGGTSREAFRAEVNIDHGTVVTATGKPEADRSRIEWLEREMDADLLGVFRQRFQAAKTPPPQPPSTGDGRTRLVRYEFVKESVAEKVSL